MKRLLLALLLVVLTASPSFGAIAATTVWEIQQDATANNVNGCGYNASNAAPGTDRSQTTTAFDSGADLASADGDENPCVVTSATHTFDGDDHGNIIHITAGTGWTAGWYEIVSTSGGAATLDRACGTDGAKTGGTWYLGGACSMNSTLDHELLNAIVAGNTVYVKYNANAIALGENVTATTSGTSTAAVSILGYKTTRGDNPTGTNRPTINGAANAFWTGNYNILKHLIITGTSSNVLRIGTYSIAENLKSTNTSGTADRSAIVVGAASTVVNCEASSTNGSAIYTIGNNAKMLGNYLHDSKEGIKLGGTGNVIAFNVIETVSTYGINGATYGFTSMINNTIYGAASPAGTGVYFTTGTAQLLYNNIISGFETGATSTSTYIDTVSNYNNFYNNTPNDRSNWATGANDVDADPAFTDAANGDFRVGANMKAAGFPGQFPGVDALDGYLDIGAVQRVEPTASGGGGAWGF